MGIQSLLMMRRPGGGRRALDGVHSFTTLVGHETRFTGTIEGKDNYIVNGTVEGDCRIDGTLVLSDQGRWLGNIQATTVVISGEVEGDITVTGKLELTPSARITGRITSPVISIAEGAIHQGEIRMTRDGEVTRFSEKREAGEAQDQTRRI
jgi:cytoskeletal protein CcmA (bactofilin family)